MQGNIGGTFGEYGRKRYAYRTVVGKPARRSFG
jgi:hypothetical protein